MSDAPRITPPPHGRFFDTELDRASNRYASAAIRDRGLDPVVFEMVRLRCAQYHDCRVCGSLRFDGAVGAGLNEALVEKIARYETSDLSDEVKVALRLTDSVIMDPASADSTLRADLAKHFTDAQIAELLFDIAKWSVQKVLVSLKLEGVEEGVKSMALDEHGKIKVIARLPEPSRL